MVRVHNGNLHPRAENGLLGLVRNSPIAQHQTKVFELPFAGHTQRTLFVSPYAVHFNRQRKEKVLRDCRKHLDSKLSEKHGRR